MRHSRSQAFADSISSTTAPGSAGHWTHAADDPNDPSALALRASVIRRAWIPEIPNRLTFLLERCEGKRVLDIGCVAHDLTRMDAAHWLHGQISSVASSCLGVDIHSGGIAEMQRRGYAAIEHDLALGLGPLASEQPFDVIVAGELIEHVESMGMLFDVAAELLAPKGELIITTPNPWAPHRVRAAQLGIVWENTDHILFAFPSGIAELASRHGLTLLEATTTLPEIAYSGSIRDTIKAVRRRLHGKQWETVGYSSLGPPEVLRVGALVAGGRLAKILRKVQRPRRRFLGESFVYVVAPRASTNAELA